MFIKKSLDVYQMLVKPENKWQDKVIMLTAIIMGIILIPMVIDGFHGHTVNLLSSSITCIGLFVLALCFWTMRLRLSVIIYVFNAVLWLIMVFQSVIL
jgi:hypothetical protein